MLNRLLGKVTHLQDGKAKVMWREGAEGLRLDFWNEMERLVPAMQDAAILDAVRLSRDVGVLLWHGIAFDDGRLDRVVEPGIDAEEIAYLSAFLEASSSLRAAL